MAPPRPRTSTLTKQIKCNHYFKQKNKSKEKKENPVSEAVLFTDRDTGVPREVACQRQTLRNRTQCLVRDPSSVPGSFQNNLGHSGGSSCLLGPTDRKWMDGQLPFHQPLQRCQQALADLSWQHGADHGSFQVGLGVSCWVCQGMLWHVPGAHWVAGWVAPLASPGKLYCPGTTWDTC